MGRVTGLDVLLDQDPKHSKSLPELPTEPQVISALSAVLDARGIANGFYEWNFFEVSKDAPEVWADILLTRLQNQPSPYDNRYRNLIYRIGTLDPQMRDRLLRRGLSDSDNLPLVRRVLSGIVLLGGQDLLANIKGFESHWAEPIRQTAAAAKQAINEDLNPEARLKLSTSLMSKSGDFNSEKRCRFNAQPLRDYKLELPFFDMEESDRHSIFKSPEASHFLLK